METNSESMAETPDMDFGDDIAEQETPDINFSEIDVNIDQDIDAANKIRERYTADDSEIDDLDEPDQYVKGEDDAEDINQDSSNQNHSESGLTTTTQWRPNCE